MLPTNLDYMPTQIVAGETIWVAAANSLQSSSDIIISDVTPADYTLVYQFDAPTPLSVTAVANDDETGWTLTVTAAQTLLWMAGYVTFIALATKDEKSFAVDAGMILVKASPLRVSEYSTALTAIETAIANFASNPQRSFSLGDMSISYGSLSELLDLRAFYKSLIARETGKRPRRIIRTRFT